jgi:heavy metal sensor kinase
VLYDSFNTQVRRRFDSAGKPRPLFTRRIDGTLFRILSEQVEADGKTYQVQVAVLTQRFDQAQDLFVWILAVAAPVFLVLAGLGGYWISRRALSPVDEITNAARTIGAQNLTDRLAVPTTGDELERLANTLNGMLGRLEAAFKRITQFTGDASHELRTPVSVIRTSAELTLRKPRSEKEYQEALGQILTEAERTSQMIEQLLDLARADSGPAALAKTATNVSEPFHEACRQVQVLAESKQLKFIESVEPQSLWIQGDAPSLERLFLILLDNAVKYTPIGGSVQARLAADNGFVVAEVKDTGIGMTAEDIPHVFDRFYRADRARSRETGGSGLGLAIGRWIAEAHGGEIRVQSEPTKGSSFQIRLPRIENVNER